MHSSPAANAVARFSPHKHQAFIALGSNVGNRIDNIEQALDAIRMQGLRITGVSRIYETKAMYYENQDDFLNGVCAIETELNPLSLLDTLQAIEKGLGRVKQIEKGPRNIDLDILLYDSISLEHERLSIPHKSMHERWFVLKPLLELFSSESVPHSSTQSYLRECFAVQDSKSEQQKPYAIAALASQRPLLKPTDQARTSQVMAILNLTPDSFSDGGMHDFTDLDEIAAVVRRFVAVGASIIDIGGQSTRPAATLLTPEEEIERIRPAIQHIKSLPEARDVLISVDTFYSKVARAAVMAGADIINDVSGGLMDDQMFPTAAALNKTIVIMHMRGTPQTMTQLTCYPRGLLEEIGTELAERVALARAAGISPWRIVLDPGIGFAKTQAQNLVLLRRFDELKLHTGLQGYPWLIGASRKGFIGKITGVRTAKERTWGTAAAVTASIAGGADIVRVHDVGEMGQVVKMADAIYRSSSK